MTETFLTGNIPQLQSYACLGVLSEGLQGKIDTDLLRRQGCAKRKC
jgi:hypothetical protein